MAAHTSQQAHLRLVSAHSGAAPTPTEQAAERELKVLVRPRNLGFWEYEGSRAQLEAEGVIPPGLQWPEGAQDCHWNDGRFRFWLRRTRPDGVKGPMKVWTRGDWWFLRCSLVSDPSDTACLIRDKTRELENLLYRQSPAGRRELNELWERVFAAFEDKAFQAFKAKFVPEVTKPGRKPKAGRAGANGAA